MKSKTKWLFIAALLFTFACRKETLPENQENGVPTTKTVRYPETQEEIAVVKRIENLSGILRKVLKNRDAIREIAAVIKGGYYTDERVKISDLLNFNQSPAYKTKLYQNLKENMVLKKGHLKPNIRSKCLRLYL